ncbi:MAG: DUF2865 domain-containing protein [Pseudomonadota bacterium]
MTYAHVQRAIWCFLASSLALLTMSQPSLAQGFQWPWEDNQPVQRQPAPRQQPQFEQQAPTQVPNPGGVDQSWNNRSPVCVKLEQRLVQETQRGSSERAQLPQLRSQIRELNQKIRRAETQLDRRDCYEYFLFSKTLRRTRQCISLANEAESARRELAELDNQRMAIESSGQSSYQDEIIRELARNNCGSDYTREARRRDRNAFSPFWQDEDSGGAGGSYEGNTYGRLPFATYRTMCVRLCDGYYFPVSFSTLPNHFQRDADVCQSQCAAPSQLYYYQNPGSSIDQMVAVGDSKPYTQLGTAFKYRKEYVQGCSCKQAEYIPQSEAPPNQQGALPNSTGRADATNQAAGATGQRNAQASSWTHTSR